MGDWPAVYCHNFIVVNLSSYKSTPIISGVSIVVSLSDLHRPSSRVTCKS